MDSGSIIENLKDKIKLIVEKYEKVQHDQVGLKTENTGLQSELEKKNQEIKELESKLSTLQYASAMSGSNLGQNKEARQKLDKLVKDLDRCVNFLKKK